MNLKQSAETLSFLFQSSYWCGTDSSSEDDEVDARTLKRQVSKYFEAEPGNNDRRKAILIEDPIPVFQRGKHCHKGENLRDQP